ncbi:hypothetical protein [Mesorhizobium sp.]|uniref:hypothetical protein n=1 Tax=Mesorhizobium sp. TaxID=1871066 RepID=UPI000FE65BDA|nr:hypothetical protein [Mesorhizobium sp.]RWK66851.1 MAG: hypothetical protein EOR54_21910 [Mesorhizobium sp.]
MEHGSEYKWVLEGFTPSSIPMTRLGEYMQQLGKLLGCEPAVHFVRVEESSVAVFSRVDAGEAPERVATRLEAVSKGSAPADAQRAYETLNEMLSDDKTRATLKQGTAVVIQFPGMEKRTERLIEVRDAGSIVGYLYGLVQVKDAFHARLRVDDGMLQCAVSDEMARTLKEHLFETVRVHGNGRWQRSPAGGWKITEFTITTVERVRDASLRSVVDQLRTLEIEWPEDPLGEWAELNEINGPLH